VSDPIHRITTWRSPVFLINSCCSFFSVTKKVFSADWTFNTERWPFRDFFGSSYSEGTRLICRVPSPWFSQSPLYTIHIHQSRFKVRSFLNSKLFPEKTLITKTIRFVLKIHWFLSLWRRQDFCTIRIKAPCFQTRMIPFDGLESRFTLYVWCSFPIEKLVRVYLRGRLVLRRKTVRRIPWIFGACDSHTRKRYSCQHSHFWGLLFSFQNKFCVKQNVPLPKRKCAVSTARAAW